MNIYTIYKAKNVITGKVYIGFDSHWPHRKNCHKCYYKKQDSKFYRAIRKYGWSCFNWCILYQSTDKFHTKDIMENHFILEYNSFNSGYNSTLGGDGTFGISKKGIKMPFNHNGWFQRKHTKKTKKLMSKNMTGIKKPNANQKGGNNNNAKKIKTPFGTFNSIQEASQQIKNFSYRQIWLRLQKNNKHWFYLI